MGRIEFGDEVKDKITGFKGVVVAIHTFMYGCTRISIQPPMQKGKLEDAKSFDEPQLIIVKKTKVRSKASDRTPGGPAKYMHDLKRH